MKSLSSFRKVIENTISTTTNVPDRISPLNRFPKISAKNGMTIAKIL